MYKSILVTHYPVNEHAPIDDYDERHQVNKIAIIVAARRGFRSADHARAFANGFIEAIAGLAIASGKFDCINHRYYKFAPL